MGLRMNGHSFLLGLVLSPTYMVNYSVPLPSVILYPLCVVYIPCEEGWGRGGCNSRYLKKVVTVPVLCI